MDLIDGIRAFNRFYTARLGILGRSHLGSGLGLTEVRILHDLDDPKPPAARALARGLGLDEGQMSRTLARLERRGWLTRRVSAGDARRRDLRLTAAGRVLVADLKARSRAAIEAMIAPLSHPDRLALSEALAGAEALLSGAGQGAEGGQGAVVLRDLAPGDGGWIVARHGALYAEDEGFDPRFEALVAEIVAAFLRSHDPVRERAWIAARGVTRLGSILCVREAEDVAKLRLFLIERQARGTGLAQHMLETCLAFAAQAGYRRIRLWTHESHRAARRLYARNGFAMTGSVPARSFGRDLVEQVWDRAL